MASESPPTQNLRSPLAAQEAAAGLPLAQLTWKTGTNQGPRKENQDCVLAVAPQNPQIANKGILLVVCDGVGGEEGGHIAANAAANEAMRAYYEEPANDPLQAIQIAIERAQGAVHGEATSQPRFGSMATTIVMAAILNDRLFVGHVGDSRAYIFRGGQLAQLTSDHTFVNAQIQSGGMTVEQAKRSIYKSTLVRSLGARGNHTPDFRTELLQPGDRVLLCSDGLYGVVEDAQIAHVLAQHGQPNTAVNNLIGAAIANQTGDNVSVALLGYGTPTGVGATTQTSPGAAAVGAKPGKPPWIAIAGALGLAAAGVLAFSVLRGPQNSGATATPTVVATTAAGGVIVSAATPASAVLPTVTQPAPAVDATSEATQAAPTESAPTVAPTAAATPAPDQPTSTLLPPTATFTPAPTRPPTTRAPKPSATIQVVQPTVGAAPTSPQQTQPTSAPSQPTARPPDPTSPPQPTSRPPDPTSPPQPTAQPPDPTHLPPEPTPVPERP